MADLCDPVVDLGHGAETLEHRFSVRFSSTGAGGEQTTHRLSESLVEAAAGAALTEDRILVHVLAIGNGLSTTRQKLAAATRVTTAGHGQNHLQSRLSERPATGGGGAETLTHRLRMVTSVVGNGLSATKQTGVVADAVIARGQGGDRQRQARRHLLTAVGQGTATVRALARAYNLMFAAGQGTDAVQSALTAANHEIQVGQGFAAWADHLDAHQRQAEIGFGAAELEDGQGGMAWTANTDTWAMSEWRGLPLSGIVWDGSALLAVAADGLYRLDADTDPETTPVIGWIETGLTDFGSPALKRTTDAYLGVSCVGVLNVHVGSTALGVETTQVYYARRTEGAAVQAKANLGKSPLSRYWRFKVVNPSGQPFILHDLRVIVDETGRRGP